MSQAADPGECLSTEEAALLQMINDYRSGLGLATVPWSKSLTEVAQWHVWDLATNLPHLEPGCNLHSWSEHENWTEVCYTSDHANAAGMWVKPNEITEGVFSASGYEISAAGVSTAAQALALWQASPGHNDVIINAGIWSSRNPWPAMGAGMFSGFAVVWFGDMTDPAGSIAACDAVTIFVDGFEAGHTGSWTRTVP